MTKAEIMKEMRELTTILKKVESGIYDVWQWIAGMEATTEEGRNIDQTTFKALEELKATLRL
jgi:hypothetical protein